MLSLESTTYPGTTEEELRPLIENKGLKIGEDIFLIYSPEREDPGIRNTTLQQYQRLWRITETCKEVGIALYSQEYPKLLQ